MTVLPDLTVVKKLDELGCVAGEEKLDLILITDS
jgi:hypothetical protein